MGPKEWNFKGPRAWLGQSPEGSSLILEQGRQATTGQTAQSEEHLRCTKRDVQSSICEVTFTEMSLRNKGDSWCHFPPPLLSITEIPAEGRYPRSWFYGFVSIKTHGFVLWYDSPSGSNLHQSQHGLSLHHKRSVGHYHTISLKLGNLNVSKLGWDRTQSILRCSRQTRNLEKDSVKTAIWEMLRPQEGKLFALLGRLPWEE